LPSAAVVQPVVVPGLGERARDSAASAGSVRFAVQHVALPAAAVRRRVTARPAAAPIGVAVHEPAVVARAPGAQRCDGPLVLRVADHPGPGYFDYFDLTVAELLRFALGRGRDVPAHSSYRRRRRAVPIRAWRTLRAPCNLL